MTNMSRAAGPESTRTRSAMVSTSRGVCTREHFRLRLKIPSIVGVVVVRVGWWGRGMLAFRGERVAGDTGVGNNDVLQSEQSNVDGTETDDEDGDDKG